MFALIAKGILVGLMIYMGNYYYNQPKSEHNEVDHHEFKITRVQIEKIPKPILPTIPTTTTRKPWHSSYQSCGSHMICVPYQRCPNRQWTDQLIDFNDTEKLCKYMEICCPASSVILENHRLEQPPLVYNPKNCNFTWPQMPGMTKDLQYVQQLTLPWTVSLLEDEFGKRKYICSGALITDRLVITDSSCFALSIFSFVRIYVVAGEFGSNLLFPKAQERGVKERINSNGEKHSFPFLNNDITMVVVDRPFKLNEDIQPICLPLPQEEDQQKFSYRNCLSTAFPAGKDAKFMMQSLNDRKYDLQLRRRFYVDPLNDTQCVSQPLGALTRDKDNNLTPSLKCMGRDEGKDRSVCFSEMGAPIVCEVVDEEGKGNDLSYRLVGLGRHSFACDGMSAPNTVMNVAHFRPWIVQKIREHHGIDILL